MSESHEDSSGGESWGGGQTLQVLGTYDARRLGLTEDEQAEQHHLGFTRALEEARKQMSEDPEWHGKTVRLRLEVWITENPGAIGEYRVWATHP